MMLVGARAYFSAGHSLPQHEAVHGHSYEVWIYAAEGACAESLQRSAQEACALLDHKMLNDILPIPSMESIARFIADHIPAAARVIINRPVEGLSCEYEPGRSSA